MNSLLIRRRRAALASLTLVLLSTLALPAPARAGTQSGGRFTMEASVVSNGGNRAQGGRFTIEGTIGQVAATPAATPAPAPSASSRFQLEAGFWTPITVQLTPGAPELKITVLSGGRVKLSWPAHTTGFTLEGCSDLANDVWSAVPVPVVTDASEHAVIVEATGLMRCFRLKK